MELKSNLRRTQSLRSVSSAPDKPTWMDARLLDKKASVSQLVARYQTTRELQATFRDNGEAKPKLHKITASPLSVRGPIESKETHLEAPMRRNDEWERSRPKTSLSRSESMGSLQSSSGSIEALKALFESKAATQNKLESSFRAAKLRSKDIMTVMDGETEEAKRSAEEQTTQIPANASLNDSRTDANAENAPQKVVNQTRTERRRTIGGIDLGKIVASQNDEKRRSVADFRGSTFIQKQEKLCISVKAISALYLSKVAPLEQNRRVLKPVQDQSSGSGKRVKIIKMAEDNQPMKDDPLPAPSVRNQVGPDGVFGPHSQPLLPSQPSKEKLHQQRQKCELRRLLKHTHPELKMLDEVVDEELAEVLSSETAAAAAETGYEGEVLSRRLIFENCALSNKVSPYTPKTHVAKEAAGRGNVCKTSAVFEQPEARPCVETDETLGSESSKEHEEDVISIDVQATRRIFESQSVKTSSPNTDNKLQGNASISGDETGKVQKQKSDMCRKLNPHGKNRGSEVSLSELPQKPIHFAGQTTGGWFTDQEEVFEPRGLPNPEGFVEVIKTNAALFQNNPFISQNVEKEQGYHAVKAPAEDVIASVKNRAHLFESMPFDKIRHQNQDEIETMVEKIKETLDSLYHSNALHSGGIIIEVNETMLAKKAVFKLSEAGPEIQYDTVAEGSSQNFILHLLPRANLKPQITYLKEGNKGNMETTMVDVPVHQRQFAASQDTEFKTANVVQLIEDILNQDNSLRKGVIIQEGANRHVDVTVYSLCYYVDVEDVRGYCPLKGRRAELDGETERSDKAKNQTPRNGVTESPGSPFLEASSDQTCRAAIKPDVTRKGNVKLLKSCIEKGDLENLKKFQSEPSAEEEEELHAEPRGDLAEPDASEWVPVNVKRLKSMFSGDQTQPKQNIQNPQTTTIFPASAGQNMLLGNGQSSAESDVGVPSQDRDNFMEICVQAQEKISDSTNVFHLETQDTDIVHQAEMVEVVDDIDDLLNLQTAIHSLQQATMEAKSFQKFVAEESTEQPVTSVVTQNADSMKTQRTAEIVRDDAQKDEAFSTVTSGEKPENQHEKTHLNDTHSEGLHATETYGNKGEKRADVVQNQDVITAVNSSETPAAQQEDGEVSLQGTVKAALDSLKRSNINVTTGDFRAAMIYRNASKSPQERLHNVAGASVGKTTNGEFCVETETAATDVLRRDEAIEEETAASAEPPGQTQNKPAKTAASERSRRPVGPKPTIPPKPERLKVKQSSNQSTNKEGHITNNCTVTPAKKNQTKEETNFPKTCMPDKDELHNTNCGADVGPDSVFQISEEIHVNHQNQGTAINMGSKDAVKGTLNPQGELNETANTPLKDNVNETDESPLDFNQACKKFGGKKAFPVKNPPVKPKRVKIAQSDDKTPKHSTGDQSPDIPAHVNTEPRRPPLEQSRRSPSGQTADGDGKPAREVKTESKVEMRGRRGRAETEDERRQRLSVHMDEIMRGNMTAAMEIFDNLRKQEELRSILSRVEEIEQDTSEVDVRSLRRAFEDVPDWVVGANKKKQKRVKAEHKEEKLPSPRAASENKSSMAHVFGDLERASEEIMNLKEQTLARLMDIEEAIKKALYSVSTLKSDSDIAGLSCLFKESLGTVQGSPSSGNISKISIGSSRVKSAEDDPATQDLASLPISKGLEANAVKQRASPPSSPAFISIQSAARKTEKPEPQPPATCPTCQHSPRTEEKFCTMKTLKCNSPAQNREQDARTGGQKQRSPPSPKRELSVFEVQTGPEGNNVLGTKTVTENYERTDTCGNRFYSSKTSTVVTTQPETMTSLAGQVISPGIYQVSTYPEVRLPINQKP